MGDRGNERGAGWVLFAAVVMVVVGGWGIFQGLAALLEDDLTTTVGGHVLIVDITTWGWIHIILGTITLLTGLGLFAGSSGAQVVAVFIVALNAIGQVVTMTVYPWWGLTLLALNIVVIWALCVYRPASVE